MFGLVPDKLIYLWKSTKGIDIREHGSRQRRNDQRAPDHRDSKQVAITLAGDCSKCILAVLTGERHDLRSNAPGNVCHCLTVYAAAGTISRPQLLRFILGFRGGKGIAATAGLDPLSLNWSIAICGSAALFFLTLAVTHYVSLGSTPGLRRTCDRKWPLSWDRAGCFAHRTPPHLYETVRAVIAILLAVLAFWEHRANIKRLSSREQSGKRIFHQKLKRNKTKSKIKTEGVFLWQRLASSEPEAWGTALGRLLLNNNGHDVTICSENEKEIESLKEHREHLTKLPGVRLRMK